MGLLEYLFPNKAILRWLNHRNLYLLGLATILCGLAWSNLLMSLGQFILIGNWLIEFNFKSKFKMLSSNGVLWLLLLIYFIHLFGFLSSENISYALKDSRIKLPLLLIPLVIASSRPLKRFEWRLLLSIYLLTILSLSLASLYKFLGWSDVLILDKRELSIYISHIRYGLNIALAILLILHFRKLLFKNWILPSVLLALWFLACLLLYELYTGLVCLLAVFLLFGLKKSLSKKIKPLWKIVGFSAIALLSYQLVQFTSNIYKDYSSELPNVYDQTLKQGVYTMGGEEYWHNYHSNQLENGVYVQRYIAWKELARAWERISDLKFKGKDKKGNTLFVTLNRFLSSKGLRKDSVALSKLSEVEIQAIENGIANAYYLEHSGIENRIHKTFYEMDRYSETGVANGYSLALRLEFWQTAWHIIQKNFWLGVGTGDIQDEFINQYELEQSSLEEKFRRRAHNQYLSIWVAFGIIGLILFLLSLAMPLIMQEGRSDIYLAFWLIACLSFLTEDTLESQAGVTFFAFFNSLFLLGFQEIKKGLPNNA